MGKDFTPQKELSIEEHNYLTDMGFVRKEFSDKSAFWYAIECKNVGFFDKVDILYDPDEGSLCFSIELNEGDDDMTVYYFEKDMFDLFIIETVLVTGGIIPFDEKRRVIN